GNCYSSSPEICTIILAGNLSARRRRLFAFLSLRRSSSKFFLLMCIHSSKRFVIHLRIPIIFSSPSYVCLT
ncbi:hypothetical protein LINGRAHAP2_LOCUS3855, partial [Linum grandiflorum]